MFQVTSRVHFMVLIPHGSVIAQQMTVNALVQQSNVQEIQFAIQVEHATVSINNHMNISHMRNIVHSNIILVINPIYFRFIHEHILLITLQQQSNPGKITNLAPGKLLLNKSMYETLYLSRVHARKNTYYSVF